MCWTWIFLLKIHKVLLQVNNKIKYNKKYIKLMDTGLVPL